MLHEVTSKSLWCGCGWKKDKVLAATHSCIFAFNKLCCKTRLCRKSFGWKMLIERENNMGDKYVDLNIVNYRDVRWTGLRFSGSMGSCGNVHFWVLCERYV